MAQLACSPDPQLADRAARLLLEERPKGEDVTRYGWLSAAQTLAIPLLPYVTRHTLEALCSDYCAAHRKRDRAAQAGGAHRGHGETAGTIRSRPAGSRAAGTWKSPCRPDCK